MTTTDDAGEALHAIKPEPVPLLDPSESGRDSRPAALPQPMPGALKGVIWAGILGALMVGCVAAGSGHRGEWASRDGISGQDRAAYDTLRAQGFTDHDARTAAPAVRRLCEAAGGSDCY